MDKKKPGCLFCGCNTTERGTLMREILRQQLDILLPEIEHARARELQQVSDILDALPQAAALVHADLIRGGADPNKGRGGMTADQVLRALLIKQMTRFSYDELAFHLADSSTYSRFARIGIGSKAPDSSTLQKNIKRMRPETVEAINRMLVGYADRQGIERGEKVRSDCTVTETHIHHPMDSSLLWDSVRVLVRLMTDAEEFGVIFNDHTKLAKRRALAILNAKNDEQRLRPYLDLLKVTHKTLRQAEEAANHLDGVEPIDISELIRAGRLASQLRHYAELVKRVIDQTQRRVLAGESVPAEQKVLSIFEPHTDIIIKDRRETLYGHKISLTTGASGLVTDLIIQKGNPADATLAVDMVKRQKEIYGRVPKQVAFDGAFTSTANLDAIKALGVEDVAFSKGRGLAIADMVKSTKVYRGLRNFRAGIEATISFLKRGFGLTRCMCKGLASFKAYVSASVLAYNLLTLARALLAQSS